MKKATSCLVLSAVALAAAWVSAADSGNAVSLGTPFTDHMVLQRDRSAPVWGWAAPGAKVTVAFAGQSKTATAGSDGKWFLTLDPLAGTFEPRELSVRSERGAIAITNVVVGGETVLVSSEDVREPRYVRYGWINFIPFSFYNLAGLPASPFRTDASDDPKSGGENGTRP
jgi:hypothetical protein